MGRLGFLVRLLPAPQVVRSFPPLFFSFSLSLFSFRNESPKNKFKFLKIFESIRKKINGS